MNNETRDNKVKEGGRKNESGILIVQLKLFVKHNPFQSGTLKRVSTF